MRVDRRAKIIALAAVMASGWVLWSSSGSSEMARHSCQHYVGTASGYDLTAKEMETMVVTSDGNYVKVQGAFMRGNEMRTAVCEFESGQPRRIAVDGFAWPDVDHAVAIPDPDGMAIHG